MRSNSQQVAELLTNELSPAPGWPIRSASEAWLGVLEVLAASLRSVRSKTTVTSTASSTPDSPLLDPRWCAAQSVEELAVELRRHRRRETHAAALRAVAHWWTNMVPPPLHETVDSGAAPGSGHTSGRMAHPPNTWRIELSQAEWRKFAELPGLSRGLAEELRLMLGAETFPFQRGVQRVGWRHGWFDEATDRDAAQHLLATIAAEGGVDRRELWSGLSEVAERWCGRQPDCDSCPLRGVLPARGPIPLGEE